MLVLNTGTRYSEIRLLRRSGLLTGGWHPLPGRGKHDGGCRDGDPPGETLHREARLFAMPPTCWEE